MSSNFCYILITLIFYFFNVRIEATITNDNVKINDKIRDERNASDNIFESIMMMIMLNETNEIEGYNILKISRQSINLIFMRFLMFGIQEKLLISIGTVLANRTKKG